MTFESQFPYLIRGYVYEYFTDSIILDNKPSLSFLRILFALSLDQGWENFGFPKELQLLEAPVNTVNGKGLWELYHKTSGELKVPLWITHVTILVHYSFRKILSAVSSDFILKLDGKAKKNRNGKCY